MHTSLCSFYRVREHLYCNIIVFKLVEKWSRAGRINIKTYCLRRWLKKSKEGGTEVNRSVRGFNGAGYIYMRVKWHFFLKWRFSFLSSKKVQKRQTSFLYSRSVSKNAEIFTVL
jgi:hypothetical protein